MIGLKDQKIIEKLKANSRATVREIAKATGIRPSTVHQRIQKLIKSGTIERFTVKLNNREAEENFIVFVLVKSEHDLDDKVFSDSHIREAFGVTGEYDLLLKLKFKDIEEFNSWLIGFRKANRIKTTLTMVGTINLKEEI